MLALAISYLLFLSVVALGRPLGINKAGVAFHYFCTQKDGQLNKLPILGLPNSDWENCPDSSTQRVTLGDSSGPSGLTAGYMELFEWPALPNDPLKRALSTVGASLGKYDDSWDWSAKNDAFMTWIRWAFIPRAVASWWLAGELSRSSSSRSSTSSPIAPSSISSERQWKTHILQLSFNNSWCKIWLYCASKPNLDLWFWHFLYV